MSPDCPDSHHSQDTTRHLDLEKTFENGEMRPENILSFFQAFKAFELFLLANGTQTNITDFTTERATSTLSISDHQLNESPNISIDDDHYCVYKDPQGRLILQTEDAEILLADIQPNQTPEDTPHGNGNPWILESTLRIVAHYFPEFLKQMKLAIRETSSDTDELNLLTNYRDALENIDMSTAETPFCLDSFMEYFRGFISIIQSRLFEPEEINQIISNDHNSHIESEDIRRTTINSYMANLPQDKKLRDTVLTKIKDSIYPQYKNMELGDLLANTLSLLFSALYYLHYEQHQQPNTRPKEP